MYASLEASVRAFTVAAPITVGLYARRHPPFERFGRLLVALGLLWFLSTFAGSSNEVVYSIGRVFGWIADGALVYVVLAFPSGRLARADRVIVGAVVVVVGLLYLPTALLVDGYPTPAAYMSCDADCPANAFMIVNAEPAFIENLLRPLRELLTLAVLAAATMRLVWRMERATHLMRRLLAPVVIVATARLIVWVFGLIGRMIDPDATFLEALGWSDSARRSRSGLRASWSAWCAGGCSSPWRWSAWRPGYGRTRVPRSCAGHSPTRSTTRRWRSCTASARGATAAGRTATAGTWTGTDSNRSAA